MLKSFSKFCVIIALGFLSSTSILASQADTSNTSATSPDLNTSCFHATLAEGAWKYCITKAKDSENPDVLYFFHGLNGNENSWQKNSVGIYAQWEKDKKSPPTVVSISFGPFWIMSPASGSEAAGKNMDTILNLLMPEVDKKLGRITGRRILAGLSLGGFNAVEFYLFYPQLFDRVALLCPALTPISPFASDQEFYNFIRETHANPLLVYNARRLARSTFKNDSQYRTVSPFEVGPHLLNASFPKLYISIGSEDDYGFYRGAEAFADLAKAQGVQTEWEPVSGGHCSFDAVSVSRFLVP